MKVQRMLTDVLGSVRIDSHGSMIVERGSTVTFIDVYDWGEDQSLVVVSSPLVLDVPLSPELYEWVATSGQQYNFGACAVVPGREPGMGVVRMRHTLLGEFLDKDELIAAVVGVARTGDELDDELQARFGGRRLTDPRP